MKHLKSILALTVIACVVGLLLAATNLLTAPIIKEQEEAKANEALKVVMPEGDTFLSMDISSLSLPESVTNVYTEKTTGGYVFRMTVTGYQPGMVILCGVDETGTVTGATCVTSGETLGYEKTYGDNFVGKTETSVGSVDTVAHATKTTAAYKKAIQDALGAFAIVKGGN